MSSRGKYVRTPEIREKNRQSARINGSCPQSCICGKHRAHPNSHGLPCVPNCQCGRHSRSIAHNMLIGPAVSKAKSNGRQRQTAKVGVIYRHDRVPMVELAFPPQPKTAIPVYPSLILDGLVPVYGSCRDCGLLMQITNARDKAHPGCEPKLTRMEQWEQAWLQIAASAPYAQLKPELVHKLDDLEFKMDAATDESADTALHNAAMTYAQWGWRVFPLAKQSKVPAIPKTKGGNGVLDATNDVQRICRWWSAHPGHNIGLATGYLFDVIDVDPDKGGAASIAKLLAEHRIPIVHAIVATAGCDQPRRPSGMHLYVRATGRGNYAGVLPGIDFRGLGGYVVAPPSTLGSRVRSWSWAVEASPNIKECN